MKLVSDIDTVQSCLESKQAQNEVLMEIIFKKNLLGSPGYRALNKVLERQINYKHL